MITLALGCGGGGSAASDESLAEQESSAGGTAGCVPEGARSLAEATPLAAGERGGCVGAEPDYYALTAPQHPAGSVFRITVVPEGGSLAVQLMDDAGERLAEGSVSTESSEMFAVAASGSTVRIAISGDSAAPTAYRLSSNATPLNDAMEPNDTPETARPLNVGRHQEALMQVTANGPEVENDYYRVLVARRGSLTARVEPGTDQLSLDLELFDANGTQLQRSVAANAGAAVSVSARVQPGQYVVKVSNDGPLPVAGFGEPPRFLTEPYELVVQVE